MIFSFNPGIILEIKNLKLFSKEKIYSIEEKDIIILSKNTFFNNNELQNKIIFTSKNNEILTLNFKNIFEGVDKIILTMKFDKLNIVNTTCQYNEKDF